MESTSSTLAANVIAILTLYVKSGTEKFSTEMGNDAAEKAKNLFNTLKTSFYGDKFAEASLDYFEKYPEKYQSILEEVLKEKLAEDKSLVDELYKLLKDIGSTLIVIQKMNEAEKAIGLDAQEMSEGKAKVEMEIDKGRDIFGCKIGRIEEVTDVGNRELGRYYKGDIDSKVEQQNEVKSISKEFEDITKQENEVSPDGFEEHDTQSPDCVNFTLTAPQMMTSGNNYEFCVWAYLSTQEQEMLNKAKEFHETESLIKKSKRSVLVQRDTCITVYLDIPGFEIDNPVDNIFWGGGIANAIFIVGIPSNVPNGQYKGSVRLLVKGLHIAKFEFLFSVGIDLQDSKIVVNQKFINSAFASYSSKDRNEVLARIQGMQKIRPDIDVFMDIVSLRSGEKWYERLKEEIKKRDVFYLFWSEAASKSKWVKEEWHTALDSKGIDFINPVPLVSPTEVPPPPELASLHFNEWTLAYIKK